MQDKLRLNALDGRCARIPLNVCATTEVSSIRETLARRSTVFKAVKYDDSCRDHISEGLTW